MNGALGILASILDGERKFVLTAEIQAEILALYYRDKRSVRSIARDLGVNRESVRGVIRRMSVSLVPVINNRASILDPYKKEIESILRRDSRVTATALFNRMRDQGYMGGMSILKDFVLTKRAEPSRSKEAYLRLEFEPGQCAQVDWGEFGDVFGDGVKVHCFAMVLCYSRLLYIEFTRSEKFEDFIRCHENAFKYFGGVPKECWYDNLATAVTERLGSLVRFNSRFMAYMGHHGIRPHACNVAKGNEKGRVEDAIKYIRNNFWSGRSFNNFEDLTIQAITWRNQVANHRVHRTTRKVVKLFFESQEKDKLFTMNPSVFGTDEIISKVVPSDFHFIYDTNRYSVPWTLTGMMITLRVNDLNIKVYYNDRFITIHTRSYQKHKVFTNESHRQGLLDRKPGSSRADWQLAAVKSFGPKMAEYIELLRSGERSLRHELNRMLALSTVYGEKAVHDACEELLKSAVIGNSALEIELRRQYPPEQNNLKPEPIQFANDRLNRIVPVADLRRYDALLFESASCESAQKQNEVSSDNITEPRNESSGWESY